jgi:hypothetical protein
VKGYWSCRVEIARARSLLAWKVIIYRKNRFSKKSDPTSQIDRNKLYSGVQLCHGHTPYSQFGMEDFNCVRKVTFSMSRWFMHRSKKVFFAKKMFPEVKFPQISFAAGYLYIMTISRNLLYVFWFEITCARSFPKSRKKSDPEKKATFFSISEQISLSDPNRSIPMVYL